MTIPTRDGALRGPRLADAPPDRTVDRRLTLFQLQVPDVIASPWRFYAEMRVASPLFDPYLKCWLLARHADVSAVLADPRFTTVMHHEDRIGHLVPQEIGVQRALRYLDAHVSFVDGPDHRRLRAALSAPFRPGHVRLLDGFVTRVVAEQLDRFGAVREPDVVADLAAAVPLRVTQRLLGLSDVDLATLRRWSTAWGDVVSAPGHLPTAGRAAVMADVDELVDALTALIGRTRRRGDPQTVTDLLVRAVTDGWLSDDELLANLMMLVTAGSETTTNLISNAVAALVDDDHLWELLRDDRTLVPAAVEEFARLYPPTQYTARTARVDVPIGDSVIRAGQAAVLLLAAANRDPAAYTDADRVRFGRPAVHHLAFGHGVHFCFGAALARLEVRRVLDGVLDQGRPRRAGAPRWRLNGNLRGMDHFPVHLPTAPSPPPRPAGAARPTQTVRDPEVL